MKACVSLINSHSGMYAAEIEDCHNSYVIFELLDSEEPELEDIIAHNDFTMMGISVYTNLTQNIKFSVYVQNICGHEQIKEQCLF